MKFAKRIANLPPYLFVDVSKKIAAKKARGEEIISFAIGDPDIPTPGHVIDELVKAARNPVNHQYPESEGMPEFKKAVAGWYRQRFNITLDPEQEVVSLIGAKEGIAHIALCLIDEGDIALVTDPGYPVYSIGTRLCGGIPYYLPIDESNQYLPDLDSIPREVLLKTRVLWLNYPNNPTGAIAGLEFFKRAIALAQKYDFIICHDGPYTEVAYDGYKPPSFLQAEAAMEVAIEFHSLSKSYNMTGWRIGMAVGNRNVISALKRLKSNLDSGVPRAIQHMAVTALSGPQDCIAEHNYVYQRRRDMLTPALNAIGFHCSSPKAGLYVWAKCPSGYTSAGLAAELIDEVGVVVTPGTGYGPHGEGYIRLSLTISDENLVKGLHKLRLWKENRS
ncbi:MAG TPA: LL-diaminopimelate aminotransferase [Dehalococcoidales bacterium]|nr:LL-diaminopimelate aminotransferase [Dehalococcoidales bacterium]